VKTQASGFTLVEVLITLTVAGMLLVALTAGTRFGLSAQDAQARVAAKNEDLVVLDQVFRKTIGHATAGSALIETPFRGQAHDIRFTTLLSGVPGGIADVSLRVDPTHRLLLTWQPHYTAPLPGATMGGSEILLADVARVDFDFSAVGALAWQDHWSDAALPGMVRLRLVGQAGVRLPDIVAATWLRDRTP
jgi:general secretion pathway protein J